MIKGHRTAEDNPENTKGSTTTTTAVHWINDSCKQLTVYCVIKNYKKVTA